MVDRQPTNPGRVRLNPVSGRPNVFDMTMADGATEQGTPLNKATFLKDATAALFGLPNTAVPDDVFAWIGRYAKHYWRRRTYVVNINENDITQNTTVLDGSSRDIQYSTSLNNDGSLNNPQTIRLSYGLIEAQKLANLAPCFINGLSGGGSIVYHLPIGTNAGVYNDGATIAANTSQNIIYLNYNYGVSPSVKAKKVNSVSVIVGEWENVSSTNRNAYPDSGIQDGYEYEYIGVPFDNLTKDHVKIETGSYVGTGTYRASNPNSLTFGFAPKFVVLYLRDASGFLYGFGSTATTYNYAMFSDELSETYKEGCGFSFSAGSSSGLSYGKKSADGKTYSWYGTANADAQANSAGKVYRYIAIG